MSLVVLGLNHHRSPVELRERLAFRPEAVPGALTELHRQLDKAGVAILSTCNRVEIYANHNTASAQRLSSGASAFLSRYHDLPEQAFQDGLYQYEGAETAGHLFRVASSLDSLVIGEAQILGQVHDAYLASQRGQVADKVIHALFQKAFAVAKAVRSRTRIGAGNVSVSSVAVDLAASIFMDLAGKTVMVIGAGETARLTLKSLVERGVGNVLALNRSLEKAKAMAASCEGEPVAFAELGRRLHRADIVITSTAAPGFILHPAEFQDALRQRDYAPMFVIDIAVPRDVEPAVAELDNVYLYNMDDLEEVVAANLDERRREMAHGMAIVERGVEQFSRWMHALEVEP
ncbi:MAG TPA: glutamyl-tRNA reductase, partial [Candidatus Hydrogenedentes bacterium]|nr:glutamyl-tRNA reductase [Candidatus Hydrogenedentota bacterium]